mmetsp:Transcript_31873/g.77257  ORF Transcript_31873/g.77257 Transcript_31873/m.77257 type:complete len:477 (-) Transcript_31873:37-1467(-)
MGFSQNGNYDSSSPDVDKSELAKEKKQLSDVAMSKAVTSDKIWWIHGNGYDLTKFVERHPGGKEAILLGRGRDCTALFESYHIFSNEHWKVLDKFCVVKNHKSSDRKKDAFYEILKERAASVLKEKGIHPVNDRGANLSRTLHYLLVIGAWLASGYWHVKGSVLGSFLFAIFGWLMGALGHDAGHFAASRQAWVNEFGVWAMSLICNPIVWQHQHTYAHHSFTNEFDKDPDLHHFDALLRVHKNIRHRSIHNHQTNRMWVAVAYALVCFGTCFWIPWGVLASGTLHGIVEWQDRDRPSKEIGLKFHWYTYIFVIMVLPFFKHESTLTAAFAVYVHITTIGIVFAIFSQINHLNEPSLEADLDTRKTCGASRSKIVKDSWAAAQVETSNNFASGSLLWHFLSNGLNHQIEHHLFPGLNHGHLHHIVPIVRDTCIEHGVVYKSYDTWGDLMNATLEWYEKLSVDERPTQKFSSKVAAE